MYGGFGSGPNGEILQDNIWANMDFIFNPVTTKKKLRDAQKAEAMRKLEEENRRKNEEFETALKNLEELKKKYMSIAQQSNQMEEAQKITASAQTTKAGKSIKPINQIKQKKTPKGKK